MVLIALLAFVRRLISVQSGGLTLTLAIALPALAIAALGAIDVTSVVSDRWRLQGITDSAALEGAKQLLIDTSPATASRAQSFAQTQLGSLAAWNPTVDAQILNDGTAVQVTISGRRPGVFRDILPSQGWHLNVSATASIEGRIPLCLLGSGSSAGGLLGIGATSNVIDLKNSSQITATNCMVQSNQDLLVEDSAQINAAKVQAAGQASGAITPAPQTGAPPIPDPFSAINVNVPSLCTDIDLKFVSGQSTLQPGVHCGAIVVKNNAVLTLAPGEHYFFAATLHLVGHATLIGSDTVLVFDTTSSFSFTNNADIELEGRQSGPLAGFVVATARDNANTFTISTTSAHKLLGVVYIPTGLLSIPGQNRVAEASAWTVIVARGVAVSGSADLTLNANYGSGSVPVPVGVGPGGGSYIQLTN